MIFKLSNVELKNPSEKLALKHLSIDGHGFGDGEGNSKGSGDGSGYKSRGEICIVESSFF